MVRYFRDKCFFRPGLIGVPEGAVRTAEARPDVDICSGSFDEKRNERGYVVPERLFSVRCERRSACGTCFHS